MTTYAEPMGSEWLLQWFYVAEKQQEEKAYFVTREMLETIHISASTSEGLFEHSPLVHRHLIYDSFPQ